MMCAFHDGGYSLITFELQKENIPTAKFELHTLLDRSPLAGVPLLVVCLYFLSASIRSSYEV